VLFCPAIKFLSAALAERRSCSNRARPERDHCHALTLIALLKRATAGQSAVARNAARSATWARSCTGGLRNLHGHLGRMGQRLGSAVEAYNAASAHSSARCCRRRDASASWASRGRAARGARAIGSWCATPGTPTVAEPPAEAEPPARGGRA